MFNYIIISVFVYLLAYIIFLFSNKIEYKKYFIAMFRGLESSSLRAPWKYSIFGLEYSLGILILVIASIAYYPALYTKKVVKYIIFKEEK